MHRLTAIFAVLSCAICVVLGRGINVGLCGETYFDCQCGPVVNGYIINIPVKQCTFFYRWKPSCKPCKDVKKDALCTTYSQCLECSQDRCTKCPPNRYGQWCTGMCTCHNGALCNQIDGSCQCLEGFAGTSCEISKNPTCPPLEPPVNGRIVGTNHGVGESISYTCDSGFMLVGSESRTCTSDTKWSGHSPHCEKTCPTLQLPANLQGEINPFQVSQTVSSGQVVAKFMKFKCVDGFQLIGPELLTCLSNGAWDNQLPQCKKNCGLPKNLANGIVINSQKTLVEGAKIHYLCNKDHILIGSNDNTCLLNGNWSHPQPSCEKVSYCPAPAVVAFADQKVVSAPGGEWSSGTEVTYACKQGSILMGKEMIECLKNGSWTDILPSCIFVSHETITCDTKGMDIMTAVNVPVQIACPDGCLKPKTQVWGTVIYKKESKLCAAAIHAGMIPQTGGSVFIVNNGMYNMFAPSNSNGVKSSRQRTPSDSFRFDFLIDDEDAKCPKGWVQEGHKCVIYINKAASWKEAVSICQNLASEIVTGNATESEASDKLLKRVIPRSGIPRIWYSERLNQFLKMKNETIHTLASTLQITNPFSPDSPTTANSSLVLPASSSKKNISSVPANQSLNATTAAAQPQIQINSTHCGVLDTKSGLEGEDCNQKLNFMCMTEANIMDVETIFCDDPGKIASGSVEAEGKIDETYPEGSIVSFRCNTLHFLKGHASITCIENGTWSGPKPSCVKVTACRDPSTIKNGFHNILPAVTAGRQGNVPKDLSLSSQTSQTPSPGAEKAVIPANFHSVGTRVQFSCESRYYNLIGSSTRTCMSDGQWSGRQPTCQPVCGISSAPRAPFIVNGQPTKLGQWPWQVGIARRVENVEAKNESEKLSWFTLCGASLLTESWVLTAAHCVTATGTTTLLAPSEMRMYFGKYFRDDAKDDDGVQIRQVEEIHVHHDFNPSLFDSDIALVRLNESVKLTSRVQPVCLPDVYSGMSERHLQAGTIGVVTGWGVDEADKYSSTLLQADVPVVSSVECENGYKDAGISLSVSGNMFCAGYKDGEKPDACSGDSGGPFVMSEGTGVHEKWYQEGIVSWGSPVGCGQSRQYGGYTKVATFLEWIQQFI